MHNDSNNILVVAILAFILGFACCDVFNNKQVVDKSKKQQNHVQYELVQKTKQDYAIKDAKSKSKSQELMDFEQMDKKFYTYLENCEPLNIKTKNGYIEYIIEGVINDKCLFKHREIGFVDTICNVPMEVAKRYSEEGMNIVRQLEELKAQDKTGFVDGILRLSAKNLSANTNAKGHPSPGGSNYQALVY